MICYEIRSVSFQIMLIGDVVRNFKGTFIDKKIDKYA